MIDKWKERIASILGDDDEKSAKNFSRWKKYLDVHLDYPVRVTGTEDFPWEEKYVLGGRNKKEYEELKKDNPSYTDTYALYEIDDEEADESEDLEAKVKREGDGKLFDVGLSWLRACDTDSAEGILLDDYSVWECNY